MSKANEIIKRIERLEETHSPWHPKPYSPAEVEAAYHRDGYYLHEVAPGATVPIQIIENDWNL